MNRRFLLQSSTVIAAALAAPRAAFARQTPVTTPMSEYPREDQPVDTRARELITHLSTLSPLAVLEALESSTVDDETLATAGATVTARPWSDPGDTDLEHALGGVLIVANDEPVNSPDLAMLGAYIVFESPEIAFNVLNQQQNEFGDQGSTTVAGAKAWIAFSDNVSLVIMRLGYVLIIASGPTEGTNVADGMVNHLDTVSAGMG